MHIECATLDVQRTALYNIEMIQSFRGKETEKVFNRIISRKLPEDIQQIAYRKLRMLHNSQTLEDIRIPPNNRLEKLKGERAGQFSIRINDKWRICFNWHDSNSYDVEITDYH